MILGVYLAGGMKSGWQDRVVSFVERIDGLEEDVRLIDPRYHGKQDEAEYTAWDIRGVKYADVVFAYLESDNPSGYGLCTEVAYAAAMRKFIIFVDEKSPTLPAHELFNMLGMTRQLSNYSTFELASGLCVLRQVLLYPPLLDTQTPTQKAISVPVCFSPPAPVRTVYRGW